MILNEVKLKKELVACMQPSAMPSPSVFYYISTEEYPVRFYAAKTIALLLSAGDAEITRIEGPAPSIEEIIASAGTISFFGTRRIVELPLLSPSAMNDADVTALCDVLQTLENAVVVITTVFADDKGKTTKKAKLLLDTAQNCGLVAELTKPQVQDARLFVTQYAESLGASLSPTAAIAMIERCGTDFFTLEQEAAKLAAAAGYGEISRQLIATFGTQNIEADVFEMVRMVTARQTARALEKLRQLLDLQNEPIAIAAALAGSFVDLYRVKCGAKQKRGYATVHTDFKYRGSNYRLKKADEAAASYTREQLAHILSILRTLDVKLKSSAVNNIVLLQTALCEIAVVGGRL